MTKPARNSLFRSTSIKETPELLRVSRLPRRDWQVGIGNEGTPEQLAVVLTQALKTPNGTMQLRPVQAAALSEAYHFDGLFGALRVGSGKTLVTKLAPLMFDHIERPLLMVPAALKEKTVRDFAVLDAHWKRKPMRIESYEMLSRVQSNGLLESYQPDMVIFDEAHRVKHSSAAVTKKFKKYLDHRDDIIVIALSGTIVRNTVMDYWHIIRWCLGRKGMPLPAEWFEAKEWGDCVDSSTKAFSSLRTAPGALIHLSESPEHSEAMLSGDMEWAVEAARLVYRNRLLQTPAVLSTMDDRVSCSLSINQKNLELPFDVDEMLQQVRSKCERPDGYPFQEAHEVWRCIRNLATGFYYRWDPEAPEDWLELRRRWSKFVRDALKHRDFNSPLEVANAIRSGELEQSYTDELGETFDRVYDDWKEIEPTFVPNAVPVWVHDSTLRFATEWMDKNDGIVWSSTIAFGERLAEFSGRPYFAGKGLTKDGRNIMDESYTGPMIVSAKANSNGHNLQRYSKNLIVSCSPNAELLEQLIGRTHRDGQTADEVEVDLVVACHEQLLSFWKAVTEAQFIESTIGAVQKLLYADKAVEQVDMFDVTDPYGRRFRKTV